jgi:hypothetical protein
MCSCTFALCEKINDWWNWPLMCLFTLFSLEQRQFETVGVIQALVLPIHDTALKFESKLKMTRNVWEFNRTEQVYTYSKVVLWFLGQFHQRFTCCFFTQKFLAQLFWTYILGLCFFGAKNIVAKSAHKMLVKLTSLASIMFRW